ncbi:MAG: nitroreductase family deazaflavin-dependent oxidoreductase [Myxococcota bacterium]
MARRDYIRWVPGERVMKWVGRIHTFLYRLTRGIVGARADGHDMLLLTTRGRRSGRLRTTPLPYFAAGGDLVLVASFGGNDRNPAWLGNLRAEPKVKLQVRGRAGEAEARVAEGDERAALWDEITREHPRYLEYQRLTSRQIPLVVLGGAARLA